MSQTKESKLFTFNSKQENDELNSRLSGALSGGALPVNLFARKEKVEKVEANSSQAEQATNELSYKNISLIPINKITTNPFQTREFDEEESLRGLAQSIEQKGLIQPIIVREINSEEGQTYELVAGERRLRAAMLLGLCEIPAIVEDLSDLDALEISIIENAQRENLNPIEEAQGYKLLQEKFKLTQSAISEVIGKNRATISNALRLLNLSEEVIDYLKSGELSAGHGRALLQIEDDKAQVRLARRAIKSELSVRSLERIISRSLEELEEEISEEEEKELLKLERQQTKVASYLGLDLVALNYDAQGRKKLSLTFESEAAWKRFVSKIKD